MPLTTHHGPPLATHMSWNSLKEAFLSGLFSVVMVLVLLNALSGTTADPDLWGYMAFGRFFWETKHFPYQDTFAYVPTLKIWVYHEWLTGEFSTPYTRPASPDWRQVYQDEGAALFQPRTEGSTLSFRNP
jgi:hypothetical protein